MSQFSSTIIPDQSPIVTWTHVSDGVRLVPSPPRHNHAGVCQECLHYGCRSQRCIQVWAQMTWMVCPTCEGQGWLQYGSDSPLLDPQADGNPCPECVNSSGVVEAAIDRAAAA